MIDFIVYDEGSKIVVASGRCPECDLSLQAKPGQIAIQGTGSSDGYHKVQISKDQVSVVYDGDGKLPAPIQSATVSKMLRIDELQQRIENIESLLNIEKSEQLTEATR